MKAKFCFYGMNEVRKICMWHICFTERNSILNKIGIHQSGQVQSDFSKLPNIIESCIPLGKPWATCLLYHAERLDDIFPVAIFWIQISGCLVMVEDIQSSTLRPEIANCSDIHNYMGPEDCQPVHTIFEKCVEDFFTKQSWYLFHALWQTWIWFWRWRIIILTNCLPGCFEFQNICYHYLGKRIRSVLVYWSCICRILSSHVLCDVKYSRFTFIADLTFAYINWISQCTPAMQQCY